jgi:S-formylglutathione hydrolase
MPLKLAPPKGTQDDTTLTQFLGTFGGPLSRPREPEACKRNVHGLLLAETHLQGTALGFQWGNLAHWRSKSIMQVYIRLWRRSPKRKSPWRKGMASRLDLIDVPAGLGRAEVPCAVLLPEACATGALPLCLVLHGGMSSRDMLVRMREPITEWWEGGLLPPMVIATASTGASSCYLDHPDGSTNWETFVGALLKEELATRYSLTGAAVLLGVSMGGYGALKIAFAHPDAFKGVAAVEPMLEPALRASDVRPRNRFYAQSGGLPADLLGPDRDPALFEHDNPANRAVRNADRIRAAGLPIYLECGDDDSLLFQDGAEFLHRVLWDLDLSHEYRLTAGADHVGTSLLPRLRAAFLWLGERLAPAPGSIRGEAEHAWSQWLEKGAVGPRPSMPLDPATQTAVDVFRWQVTVPRAKAALEDPTALRRFGRLTPTGL